MIIDQVDRLADTDARAPDLGLADTPATAAPPLAPWQILVVDDDPEVHLVTRLALERYRFEGRPVQVLSAHSAREAQQMLPLHDNVALILLDVVMETDHSGLDFVRWVRDTLRNTLTRIVLRTGQPGQAPPREIVTNYEIDDYRTKTELTYDRLIAVVTTTLRSYRLLLASERQKAQLIQANGELEQSERRAQLIFEGASDGMFITDEDFIILDCNPAAAEIMGRSIQEVRGTHTMAHVPPSHITRLPAVLRAFNESGVLDLDFPILRKDGGVRLGHMTGRRLRPGLFVTIMRDVTQQRRDEEMIRRLAFTDLTTGLLNMTALERHLNEAIAAAQKGRHACAVILVRVGDFREINNTLGHDNGNRLLKEVARRLQQATLEGDEVGRIGGSQFAVLVRHLSQPDHLERVLHKLTEALSQRFELAGVSIDALATLGAAVCPDHGSTGINLLRCADVALGAARRQHQPYLLYGAALDPHTPARLSLVHDLSQALKANELELWYQPKVDLRSGRVNGVEALLRWHHAQRGMVSPEEFIHAAERTLLIDDITVWVTERAVRQAQVWHNAGLRLTMSMNLSLHNLRRPGFAERLLERFSAAGLPAETLMLEITETAAMDDPALVLNVLQNMRRRGIGIALDDFGIGQSSLAHLMRLPVNELKLDKSFVSDLTVEHNAAIVRSTIKLAHDLKLRVTAEGVETRDALVQLRQMGCDTAQGYLISRAMPAAEFERWLDRCQWQPLEAE